MSSLATLRTAVRRYINETDSANSHFSDSQINDFLNQAVTFLATQMEWPEQTSEVAAVAGQTLYGLPSDFIALVDVYFDSKKLVILERADLGQISPVWQQDPNGTPVIAYKDSPGVIGLYRTPDTTQDGKTIQIQYIYLPPTLSADSDIPAVHAAFQMCLPFYAAFLCDYQLGNDKKSDVHLKAYDNHRKALMSKLQRFSDDLFRFRWGWNYPERNQ